MELKFSKEELGMCASGEKSKVFFYDVIDDSEKIGTVVLQKTQNNPKSKENLKKSFFIEIIQATNSNGTENILIENLALKEKIRLMEELKIMNQMIKDYDPKELRLPEKLKFILECDDLMIKFGKNEVVDVIGSDITLKNGKTLSLHNIMSSEFKIFESKEIEPDGDLLKLVKRLKRTIKTFGTKKQKFIVVYNISLIESKKELKTFLKLEDYQDLNYLTFYKLKEKRNYLSEKENFKEAN